MGSFISQQRRSISSSQKSQNSKDKDLKQSISTMPSTRSGKKKQQQKQQSSRLIQSSQSSNKKSISLLTMKERNQLANGIIPIQSATKLLLSAPFSNFNQYTRRIFLTGFAGIIPENLHTHRIGYIIALAKEMTISATTKDKTISAEVHKFMVNYLTNSFKSKIFIKSIYTSYQKV